MQSTGQTSTQALSFTLMQGSAMIYAITASCEPHGLPRRRSARGAQNLRSCINLPRRCQAVWADSERPELGVERVAERIAEKIEGEYGQTDGEPREHGHPGRRLGEVHGRAAQHEPPRRGRLLHPEAE